MIFEYQALNKKGETVSNLLDASSEISARQKLRSMGLYVVRIQSHDIVQSSDHQGKDGPLGRIFHNLVLYISLKLSSKQIGLFSKQLATLLKAGLPLLVAINDIIDQIDNMNFKQIIVDIKEKLEEGTSFSNCLLRHKNIFSDMYINMVRVGENLGSLDEVIERLADIEEKRNLLKNKIQAALWYPSFLALFSIIVVSFLMISVIPSLSRMFTDMGKELPLPTIIVIGISDFLSSYWYIIIILICVVIYFFNRYSKTPEGSRKMDELKLKMPVFKNFYKKLIVLKFAQNLGILLNNKVDMLKSFEIVKKIVGNIIIAEKIEEAGGKIREGSTVSNALSKHEFLPKLVIGMISAGEASDNLDNMLLNIGRVYETELDMTVTSMTSMIEPVIIVLMGLAIGTIVVAVLLPIFEMNLLVQ